MINRNPYWDAVRDHVTIDTWYGSRDGMPVVGGLFDYRTPSGQLDIERWSSEAPKRDELVRQYAWTITDPDTVAFVTKHSRDRIVDPLAGTGYWAWVLADVDVISYDIEPPTPGSSANHWHSDVHLHWPVLRANATDAVIVHSDRTLLLSWPPYNTSLGVNVLRAYEGDRVIYVGEDYGGCCGDDKMFETLERDWTLADTHVPVQWFGLHDVVNVYDRKKG